jgi:hypothetical protein
MEREISGQRWENDDRKSHNINLRKNIRIEMGASQSRNLEVWHHVKARAHMAPSIYNILQYCTLLVHMCFLFLYIILFMYIFCIHFGFHYCNCKSYWKAHWQNSIVVVINQKIICILLILYEKLNIFTVNEKSFTFHPNVNN